MAQTQTLKAKGLYTFPNDFSEIPEGGLLEADNVEIKREGVIEPRRGFEALSANLSGISRELIDYKNTLLAHNNTNKLSSWSGTAWSDKTASVVEPDNSLMRIKHCEANNNLYFTTADGIKKLANATDEPLAAGLPQALDGEASAATGSFLDTNKQVAYRMVWGYKDDNDNLILSAPSGRVIFANTIPETATAVQIIATIPDEITVNHFIQLYRSDIMDTTIEPTDTMQLVLEQYPTSGEIIAKLITLIDDTPENLRGAYLYTSETQEGILQSNYRPPWAKDIDVYKGYVFYANCKRKQSYTLTLLGTGGTNGLQADDVITIAGIAFTAKGTETIASAEFKVFTGGSTVSEDIANTTDSLIRVINRYSGNTKVYAHSVSGYNDLPGKILIEERTIGGASFALTASAHGSAYRPELPTTGTLQSSVSDEQEHALYYSKFEQSEHVPIVNKLLIGSANYPIWRIIALRDAIIIFKPDAIYRLTGYDPSSWRVDILDSTTNLLAPDSAVALNNQVFALTTQGVVSVTDTGVTIRSRPIEDKFLTLYGVNDATLRRQTFAVPYESDRKYLLWTISNVLDTYPTQCFVYNLFTNAWTKYKLSKSCGMLLNTDGKLYLGAGDSGMVSKERKSFTYKDYIDEGTDYTIDSININLLYMTDVTGITVGDLVYQSSVLVANVTAVDTVNKTITISPAVSFTAGTCTIYKAIPSLVEFAPEYAGNIHLNKHYREVLLLFKEIFAQTANVGFKSNISQALERIELSGQSSGIWGLFGWGQAPWGGIPAQKIIRIYVPREKQRCAFIRVRFEYSIGYGKYLLDGVSYVFNPMSERVSR